MVMLVSIRLTFSPTDQRRRGVILTISTIEPSTSSSHSFSTSSLVRGVSGRNGGYPMTNGRYLNIYYAVLLSSFIQEQADAIYLIYLFY